MTETRSYKLGEIARFINGRAYLMPEMLHEGKYRIVRVGNFTGKDEWYYSDMELEPDKYCEKGDLLFKWACTFGPEIWQEEKSIFHYHIWKVIPDSALIDKDYFYYMLSYMTPKWLKATNGSTMVHITKETMEDRSISLPVNLLEQKRVAEVLRNIDNKITNNNAIITELESMAKDIYDYWFVQFDFPDENGKPYKSSGGKMVWNEELKREIPEGWKPAKFGDFVTIKRGISYSASNLVDDGFPMINLNSFTPSATYKTSGIKYFSGEIKESGQVNAYDLLMCTTQQTDIDGKTDIIGKTMLVPDLFNSKMVFSMDLVRIHTDELLKTMIVSETKTPWYNKYITGFATGTSILHLKLDGFLSYQIPLPEDTAVMRRFNSMYMEWERKKSIAMKENEELTSLRDWLLPMLMNGQVKVGGVA